MSSTANFELHGMVVDVVNRRIFPGKVVVRDGKIKHIEPVARESVPNVYILPGLIDSHVHIESSLLVPREFARVAVIHGTVATVSDPHEIANVLGMDGIYWMLDDAERVPFKIFFGAPPCVPATPKSLGFEIAGAEINLADLCTLLDDPRIRYEAEMMNWPGVLSRDEDVMAKVQAALERNLPVDGHSPDLMGDELRQYCSAGITSNHEMISLDEARQNAQHGMLVAHRKGSAAWNFEQTHPILTEFPELCAFCTDDCHADLLLRGHINEFVKFAIQNGYDFWTVLRAACVKPVEHYRLPVGQLQPGDPADFIVLTAFDGFNISQSLKEFVVEQTFVDGVKVAENGHSLIEQSSSTTPNRFNCEPITLDDVAVSRKDGRLQTMEFRDGRLDTGIKLVDPTVDNGNVISDPHGSGVLKLVTHCRYEKLPPAVGFVSNFIDKSRIGNEPVAIAGSVGHDCHNLVSLGFNDELIVKAMNKVVKHQGALVLVTPNYEMELPLPVAGLMSNGGGFRVGSQYSQMDQRARELLGIKDRRSAPFCALSFLMLLVIPEFKLGPYGPFNGKTFELTGNFVEG